MLKWQQSDLAKKAHLSLTAVNYFEREIGITRESTQQALQTAFEEHGVEFLQGGGIRQIEEIAEIIRFSGKNSINDLDRYIMQTPLNPGDEILLSSCDEEQWKNPQYLQSAKTFHAWVEQRKLKIKRLVSDNRKTFPQSFHAFRILPSEMIGKIAYTIWGSKIAFILWKKKQVIIIHNNAVAETFRNQFNYHWKIGRPIG
ncbi:MAG: hypothetical protein WC464_03890 [Bdellovibrionales bacterium]